MNTNPTDLRRKYNILIVDDEPGVRTLFEGILADRGYHVFTLPDATNLDETLDKNNIDLVTLDIVMPGIDGVNALKKIRANPKYKNLKIVMVPNIRTKKIVSDCYSSGANGYFDISNFKLDTYAIYIEKFIPEQYLSKEGKQDLLGRRKTNILLLYSEPDLLQMYKDVLEEVGYRVYAFTNPIEAKEAMDTVGFDLIISTVIMAKEDGINFIERVKAEPKLAKIPFVFLTNLDADHVRTDAFSLGATEYWLVMEIVPVNIVREVERVLSRFENPLNPLTSSTPL